MRTMQISKSEWLSKGLQYYRRFRRSGKLAFPQRQRPTKRQSDRATTFSEAWRWIKVNENWLWISSAILLSAIVHILIVLCVPWFATNTGWNRLASLAPVNEMHVFAPVSDKKPPIPLLAPDIRYAFCRYDISDGPVTVRAPMPNALWSIAISNRYGDNFYTISGSDLRRTEIELVISQADEAAEAEAKVGEKSETDNVVAVKAPFPQGVLLIRAPVTSKSYEEMTETLLKKASCNAQ